MNEETRKTEALYLMDGERPARFGQVTVHNVPTQCDGLHEIRPGVPAETVIAAVCGSDLEYVALARKGRLHEKYPPGRQRLINGHEGLLWVPSEERYGILHVRGGSDPDPTRYAEGQLLFEYGCHRADGLFSRTGFFNPDMILPLPTGAVTDDQKLDRKLALRMLFSDTCACVLFLAERIQDVAAGHNWRLFKDQAHGDRLEAERLAVQQAFTRVLITGCGTSGFLAALLFDRLLEELDADGRILVASGVAEDNPRVSFLLRHCRRVSYLNRMGRDLPALAEQVRAELGGGATVVAATSGHQWESQLAFDHHTLGNNGIYASFSVGPRVSYDTFDFVFANHLIFGSVNFRRDHMREAARRLVELPLEELVKVYRVDEVVGDPTAFYDGLRDALSHHLKAAIVWQEDRLTS